MRYVKRTYWLNLWLDRPGKPNVQVYSAKEWANSDGEERIACIPVEVDCPEGTGCGPEEWQNTLRKMAADTLTNNCPRG